MCCGAIPRRDLFSGPSTDWCWLGCIASLPVATENSTRPGMICEVPNRVIIPPHVGMVKLLLDWLVSLVKSRRRLKLGTSFSAIN